MQRHSKGSEVKHLQCVGSLVEVGCRATGLLSLLLCFDTRLRRHLEEALQLSLAALGLGCEAGSKGSDDQVS